MSLTKVIKINPVAPQAELIKQVAEVLAGGGLVIIPTETVYGIAADSTNKKALAKLYEIKKRPLDKPFALLIAQEDQVRRLAHEVPVAAYKLMDKFWPGPLTLILKSIVSGKVGLRMPDNAVALAIINQSSVSLACPSANLADLPAPADFAQAIKDLDGQVDLAIDAGATKVGLESTIVDLTAAQPQIIRQGAIQGEEIMQVVKSKNVLFVCTGNSCRSVMAEAYLKKLLLKNKRTDVCVASAGVMAMTGTGASFETREVLAKEGMDVSSHTSQRVTQELINRSDIILAMEDVHEERILQLSPDAKNRVFLLKEFAKINDSNLNITDPVGSSLEFYQEIFFTIKDAVERISKIL